ncbi:unnamed protein product [Spodoptera exigua]|nr:unnamed protein product [Spodoptera exigua]
MKFIPFQCSETTYRKRKTRDDEDNSVIVETENQEEDDYYNVEPEIQEDQFLTVTGRRNKVYECCEKTAAASMQDAAEEEKKLAIAEGRTKNGIPVIDVYVDAFWCARLYGSNYKAASDTAAIIGRKTEEGLVEVVERKREEAQKRKNNSERPAKRKIRKLADTKKKKQNDYGPASLDPDMTLSGL